MATITTKRPATQRVIELDAGKVSATFTRDGIEYTAPTTDSKEAVSAYLEKISVVRPAEDPRVIQQSPRAGTLVAPGTAISLEMLPPDDTRFVLFPGVHAALKNQPVTQVAAVIAKSPELTKILSETRDASEVDAESRAKLTQLAGVVVDERAADTTFASLYYAYQIASVYK